MRLAAMDTAFMNRLAITTEEIDIAERKLTAFIKSLFAENTEKPFGLELSSEMKAKLYL